MGLIGLVGLIGLIGLIGLLGRIRLCYGLATESRACGAMAQRAYAVALRSPAPEVEAAFFSPLFFAAAKKRGCRPAQGQRMKNQKQKADAPRQRSKNKKP